MRIVLIFVLASLAVHQSQQVIRKYPADVPDIRRPVNESIWVPASWEPITTLTVLLAIFTLTLAIVAIWQIRFLRSADEIARKSADAAKAAADTAIASIPRQIAVERAYVIANNTTVEVVAGSRIIVAKWRNAGNTPATHVRAASFLHIRSSPLTSEDGINYEIEFSKLLFWTDIPPKDVVGGTPIPVHDGLIVAIGTQKSYVYLVGWLEYYDIFDVNTRHRSELCARIHIRAEDVSLHADVLVSMDVIGRHNGADATCQYKPATYPQRTPPQDILRVV